MIFMSTGISLSSNLFRFLSLFIQPKQKVQPPHKIHDFTQLTAGSDYMFEFLDEEMKGCITGTGKNIKPRDYIILQHNTQTYRYQIEEIDYYSDPSDMWIALLHQVDQI